MAKFSKEGHARIDDYFNRIYSNKEEALPDLYSLVEFLVDEQEAPANTGNQQWCGQAQPHPPHIWAKGHLGWYTNCSGHS